MVTKIGVIGLGAMGSAMAARLLSGGYRVAGMDIRQECLDELAEIGGAPKHSVADLCAESELVITSLNNEGVFRSVVAAICAAPQRPRILVDACTLSVDAKTEAHDALAKVGVAMLDCTVSGNRHAVQDGTLSLYASGDESVFAEARPALAVFTKAQNFLGAFGNAARMKFILNFLIVINNAATAEAMNLARNSGMDLAEVYRLVCDSYAMSVVFRQRGRMMLEQDYVSSRGTYGIARKDSRLISDFAQSSAAPTPLFHAALQMHVAAMAQGYTENDTASLFEVYGRMSGAEAVPPQMRNL